MSKYADLGIRYRISEVGAKNRGAAGVDKTSVTVLSVKDYVKRATVDAATSDGLKPVPAVPQVVALQPNRGNRVLPLLNIVPTNGEEAAAAEEGTRTEAADAAAYGSALPQSNLSLTRRVTDFKRLGVWVEATKGVVDDSSLFDTTVSTLMDEDFDRVADAQVLSGSGTGENVAGILDASWSVPTSALGVSTRWRHLLGALATIRTADHAGPLDCVIHPTALLALLDEADANDEPTWKRKLAEEFGFRSFVTSTLVGTDKAIVADFHTLATAWIRKPGIELSVSTDHGVDFFVKGKVAIALEARWAFRVNRPSAGVVLTGL